MAENEGGDSKFLSGFLVGFLVGVLICLGIGGTFAVVHTQRESAMMHRAMAEEEAARAEAIMARDRAEAERQLAEEALRNAKDAIDAFEKLPAPKAEQDR